MDYDPLRRGIAEFVGTFALIFVGAGSILALTALFEPAITNTASQGVYGGLALVAVAPAHRRRDEPGARLRAGARLATLGRRVGLVRRPGRRRRARRACVRLAVPAP